MKKKSKEPAQKLLTMKPAYEASLDQNGFIGALYQPTTDCYPGKVLIMAGGTDGSYSLTKLLAEQYVKKGLSVLALAYWNQEGLPISCSKIPLETVQTAAFWLQSQNYEKIGIWGISQGAVYSLLCASYMPQLLSCVVAVSPMCVCGQGLQKKNEWIKKTKLCSCSTFTFKGQELDYVPLRFSKWKIFSDCIKTRELCELSMYQGAVQCAPESARIPVEQINGPVLLLAADHDSLWESKEAAEYIVQRLHEKGFTHSVVYKHYPFASHYLLPYPLFTRKLFRIERKYPDQCLQSNLASFEVTLNFLKNHW